MANRPIGKSKNGAAIVAMADTLISSKPIEPLASRMKGLFIFDVLTQSERENMITRFHSIRQDSTLRDCVIESLNLAGTRPVQIMFYQTFLAELLAHMLKGYVSAVKQQVSLSDKGYHLSESDKETLYYVSGYVVKKLGDKQGLCNKLVGTFSVQTNPEGVPSEWTTRLDRGGLRYATQDFYELLVQCDKVIGHIVAKALCAKSLLKDSTVEQIMETHAVKLQWDKLCAAAKVDVASTMTTWESVVQLFLTVKGFSIAHRIRHNIAEDMRRKKSLRHSLQGQSKHWLSLLWTFHCNNISSKSVLVISSDTVWSVKANWKICYAVPDLTLVSIYLAGLMLIPAWIRNYSFSLGWNDPSIPKLPLWHSCSLGRDK